MAVRGEYVYEWPRPMVTTDALVFSFVEGRARVLLIRRGKEPFKGQWAVPGGFLELDEELEDAAKRELEEETGLAGVELEQMRTFGTIGRDPRGRQITVVFTGVATHGADDVKGGDDAAEARWFFVDELPGEIAFDHREVIEYGVGRLEA